MKLLTIVGVLLAVSTASSWAYFITSDLPGNEQITMKFVNWDEGTVYDTSGLALNTPTDVSGLPILHSSQGSPTGEDSWGIFQLTTIYNTLAPATVYYDFQTNPYEVTGIFWGEVDKTVTVTNLGASQEIRGDNLHFAFFEDATLNFSALGGPTARDAGGLPIYPTVTDGALIWTGTSSGMTPDSNPYSFYSKFSPGVGAPTFADATGTGNFLGELGGTPYWGTGPLNGMFSDIAPDIQMKFQFSADTDGRFDWLLSSNDPVKALTTPELSSGALLLLGFVPMGLGWWRRRKA